MRRTVMALLALGLVLGGLSLVVAGDAVLGRCYPTGQLAPASRYYVTHWGTLMAGYGATLGVILRETGDATHRAVLGLTAGVYSVMIANFWQAYSHGRIPYVRTCLWEEIGFEVVVAAVLVLGLAAPKETV